MTYSLIDLLPYSDVVQIKSLSERIRILQLLAFFCRSTSIAVQSFLSQEYNNFDAQVSENLCQIRAYQLIQFVGENNKHFTTNLKILVENANKAKSKCESLLAEYISVGRHKPSNYTRAIDKTITLQELLLDNKISIDFSDTGFFIVQAFILSRYKLIGDYEISCGIDYDKICRELDTSSKTYARKIVHRLQRNISMQSCQFIFKLMYDLGAGPPHLHLLKSLYFKDEVGRHVMSCYEVTKIILQHARQTGKYIKIIAMRVSERETDSATFILKPSSTDNSYSLVPNSMSGKNKALIVFAGIVRYKQYIHELKKDYIKRFLDIGVENIIMANMAQHPQYSGLLLDDKKFNPYGALNFDGLPPSFPDYAVNSERQFLKHKYISGEIGCNQDAPDLFLLTHVRCNYDPARIYQSEALEAILL